MPPQQPADCAADLGDVRRGSEDRNQARRPPHERCRRRGEKAPPRRLRPHGAADKAAKGRRERAPMAQKAELGRGEAGRERLRNRHPQPVPVHATEAPSVRGQRRERRRGSVKFVRHRRNRGRQAGCGRRAARQRRLSRDIFVCCGDAGCIVPPRRHRLDGVRLDQAGRCRSDPRQGRRNHRRRQPLAAGERPGHPHPPQPPADAVADQRRPADGESWTLIFADPVQTPPLPLTVMRNITDPALANVGVPLANPGSCIGWSIPTPATCSGGDRAAADPRLHQAAGFRRTVAARIRPWRGGSSELRRRQRRGRRRQGHARQAGWPHAVIGQRRGRARHRRGPSAVRRQRVAQEPRGKVSPAAGCADRRASRSRA